MPPVGLGLAGQRVFDFVARPGDDELVELDAQRRVGQGDELQLQPGQRPTVDDLHLQAVHRRVEGVQQQLPG